MKNKKYLPVKYLCLCLCSLLLFACSKKPEVAKLPQAVTIAVAPFNQPVYEGQLLAGYLPDEQNTLDGASAGIFSEMLNQKLKESERNFIFLTNADLKIAIQKDSKGRSNVLSSWAQIAQKHNADYIIVPQILDIEELRGDARYVRSPARLISDIYLIKAVHPENESLDGYLQERSHYRELTYINDKGSENDGATRRQRMYVVEFVKEAIDKAIRDFKL